MKTKQQRNREKRMNEEKSKSSNPLTIFLSLKQGFRLLLQFELLFANFSRMSKSLRQQVEASFNIQNRCGRDSTNS
jgi:hypothetical protein